MTIIISYTFLRCVILDLIPGTPSPATKTISSSYVGVLFFYVLLKHSQLKIVALVFDDVEFHERSLAFSHFQMEKMR